MSRALGQILRLGSRPTMQIHNLCLLLLTVQSQSRKASIARLRHSADCRHSSHGSIAVRLPVQYAPDCRCGVFGCGARLHMGLFLGLVGRVCPLGGFQFVLDVQRQLAKCNLGFANIRHHFCVLPLG